jgi:LysR family transcriptional regulator, carnitine catabolism transcriptional activator
VKREPQPLTILTDLMPSTFRREMTAPHAPMPDEDAQSHENRADSDRPRRVADLTLRGAMQVKISWVRSFLAVAERGGFGAATSKLHLSQSRVSAHIAALEELLGFELLERRVRPTALTEPGRIFAEHAKEALDALQDGIEAARAALRPGYGHLVVGSYPSVSSVFLPSVLATLSASHPAMSIELREGNAASLEAALSSGAVDVAFRPLQPPVRDHRLPTKPLWREPIAAVMRDDDVLATQARVAIGDLEGRALIGNPSGSWEDGGGFDLRRAAGEAADELNIVYLTDQPATLVALVRAAFGIGVISQLALATTPTDGIAVRQIDSPSAFRDVALFWNDQGSRNPSLAAFVEAVTCADPPQIAQRLEADEA